MLKRWWEKTVYRMAHGFKDERGAMSLEWIALGLLAIVVISTIITAIKSDTTMGTALSKKIAELIGKIGSSE